MMLMKYDAYVYPAKLMMLMKSKVSSAKKRKEKTWKNTRRQNKKFQKIELPFNVREKVSNPFKDNIFSMKFMSSNAREKLHKLSQKYQ